MIEKTARLSFSILKELRRNQNNYLQLFPKNYSEFKDERILTFISKDAASAVPALVSKDEHREFLSVFHDIVKDITDSENCKGIPQLTQHVAKALEYNVPHGRKSRGLGVVASYKLLESREKLTSKNIRLANILGWCVEMLQGSLLIVDDIIDASETRRGRLCWYRNEDVASKAIHDSIVINKELYWILTKYFSEHPAYVPMMELFQDITLKTSLGKTFDIMSAAKDELQLKEFTMTRYKTITKYKTASYTFYLPIALAMNLTGRFGWEMYRQVKIIALEMGHFHQVENDFLDCFGNPEIKLAGDIKQGRCSWLAVVALQRVTPAQRQILEHHYGKASEESQTAVRNLYLELDLPKVYSVYKEESFNLICKQVEQISKELPKGLFFRLIENLYGRECEMFERGVLEV